MGKAKGEEGTRRMLAMLLGSQAELLEKAMFTGWRDYLIDLKRQREVDRIKSGMKAKGDESTKRMLAMLMGSQMDVLKKAAFAGWWEHLREDKLKMRSKEDESRRRMLGMLVGSQSSLVMKIAFTGWSDSHFEAKKLREVERMRREMRSKGDESTKRML